jgi:hypothetical protein
MISARFVLSGCSTRPSDAWIWRIVPGLPGPAPRCGTAPRHHRHSTPAPSARAGRTRCPGRADVGAPAAGRRAPSARSAPPAARLPRHGRHWPANGEITAYSRMTAHPILVIQSQTSEALRPALRHYQVAAAPGAAGREPSPGWQDSGRRTDRATTQPRARSAPSTGLRRARP